MGSDCSGIWTKVLVRDVMNTPVMATGPNTPIDRVARKMVDLGVGSIVVIRKEKPVGIITNDDIISKVVSENIVPGKLTAAKIMSSPIETIEATKELPEAARLLRKLRVNRLGVVNKGDLIGMISITDILAVSPELIEILSEKAKIITGRSREVRGHVEGYCDNCGKWSDSMQEMDDKYICEECRFEFEEIPEE